ncbi:MAG: hypothetical protein ACP5NZ_02130 [Nanobdellota archaeon]
MQGTWVNNLPVTLVNDGPLIDYCSNCGTLYVNTSLIPLSQPRDLSYLFSNQPKVEIMNTRSSVDWDQISRQQDELKESVTRNRSSDKLTREIERQLDNYVPKLSLQELIKINT